MRIPLCPARLPVNGEPCLQPLPCREHEIDDPVEGSLVWGSMYVFEEHH
jgi:hypothetical protein